MRGLSLRARVTAAMAVVAVVLVVVAVVITRTTRNHLVDQVDTRLATAGNRFRDVDREGDGDRDDHDDHEPSVPPDRLSDVYEGVLLDTGVLYTFYAPNLGAGELPGPALDVETAAEAATTGDNLTVGALEGDDLHYRVQVREAPDGLLFVTAIPLTDVEETIDRLVVVETIATVSILALLALVAWWVIRLGIRPIKTMTDVAASIAGGDLSHRVPESAPSTEAGQLGVALNQMLGRIEDAFDQQARSEERLRQFVADASHELRTPVTTIRGYAELYRAGGLAEVDDLSEAMRRTEQEAVRMARLIDDMLTLARLDQGRPLETLPIDLAPLVSDAARDAAAVDPDRPISTEIDGPVVVRGDEDRLRQVIANVVGNALVHTPAETPIELRLSRRDGVATIDVVDHGPGMRPEVAERVTERFFRADPSRTRHRGGSGLGLSIADSAVRAHGGRLWVESTVGAGTTVHITLPVAPA